MQCKIVIYKHWNWTIVTLTGLSLGERFQLACSTVQTTSHRGRATDRKTVYEKAVSLASILFQWIYCNRDKTRHFELWTHVMKYGDMDAKEVTRGMNK